MTSSHLRNHCFFKAPPEAKKGKKGKEPEAPILYDDPPDKLTTKDDRAANMKITSWNVDGLRAWVKKKGLDVSAEGDWVMVFLGITLSSKLHTCAVNLQHVFDDLAILI